MNDAPPGLLEAIGTVLVGVLVFVWSKIQASNQQQQQSNLSDQWVKRVEVSVRRSNQLANEIALLVLRVGNTERRQDKHEKEFDDHMVQSTHGFERLARIEEQMGQIHQTQVDTREDVAGRQERTEKLLEDVLHELRVTRLGEQRK